MARAVIADVGDTVLVKNRAFEVTQRNFVYATVLGLTVTGIIVDVAPI